MPMGRVVSTGVHARSLTTSLNPMCVVVDSNHDLGRILTPRSLAILREELEAAATNLEEGYTLERVLAEHRA